jgi:hypothetical protein
MAVMQAPAAGREARPPRPRLLAGAPPDGAWREPLDQFVRAQALNTGRHVAALRPFRPGEFGSGQAAPSEAHVQAANELIRAVRRQLLGLARQVTAATRAPIAAPGDPAVQQLITTKERAGRAVKFVERIWDFYLEMFSQRQARFADWLDACDRIALECYQAIYTGLGAPRSIPSPAPLCYMATGSTPATFRRGVALSRLGSRANPFPVIQLPYHRLVNPWTLGAVHHEVSHNIQSDLGLWEVVPRRVYQRLRQEGIPPAIAATWARWHKEIWADVCGILLGGPAVVASLIDVVAGTRPQVLGYNPEGVHPVSYLRVLIAVELLRRMDFPAEAAGYRALWQQMYPRPHASEMPPALLDTFPRANALVVDTLCFQPYGELGGRSLAQVSAFRPLHQRMTEEAGERIARGTDPGIIPARFLVGATRWAVDRHLAPPGTVARNFYQALLRR